MLLLWWQLAKSKGGVVSPEQTKPRKILGYPNAPYLEPLKNLISSQSRETVLKWSIDYVEANLLPIFEVSFPEDFRPRAALASARNFITDQRTPPEIKVDMQPLVLACHAAARAAESIPAAQAAARACAQASSAVYELGHTLGIAYFGSAATAYAKVGLAESAEVYDAIAAEECARQCAALREVAVERELNPSGIEWRM